MNDVNNFVKVDGPDDPERCTGRTALGPCPNKYVPGSKFCLRHGGAYALRKNEQEKVRMYKLTAFQQRHGELTAHADMKSLAGEIAIIRMTLEEVINSTGGNTNELLARIPSINMLANTTEKLVQSLQKIQERNNLLLDKAQIVTMGQGIIALLTKYVTDPEQLATIAMELTNVIEKSILVDDPAGSAT
jgi:hypothetical protein